MDTITESKEQIFTQNLTKQNILPLVQKEAINAIDSLKFPTTRVEDWKYTRTSKIAQEQFKTSELSTISTLDAFKLGELDCYEVLFENGFYQDDLSDKSSFFLPLKSFDAESIRSYFIDDYQNIFQAINAGYINGGLVINIPKNTTLDKPIHIIHAITDENTMANVSHLINVGQNSDVKVILSYYASSSKSFHNVHVNFDQKANSSLKIYQIQDEKSDSFHYNHLTGKQSDDSRVSCFTFPLKTGWVRNDLQIEVQGQNCETNLFGTYTPSEGQHIDNHTMVDHQVPNCISNELYKGVIHDKGTGVFNGKVFVRKDAQKVNAFQSNANILMTDNAQVYTKPELEIYADDVKCSHGSTTGQIDEEALFYLRARGMSPESSKKLLVEAFLDEVYNEVEFDEIIEKVKN